MTLQSVFGHATGNATLSKSNCLPRRIDDGSYGYCEETDEPISLKRLEARPIASLSLDAQERHERNEKRIETIKGSSLLKIWITSLSPH